MVVKDTSSVSTSSSPPIVAYAVVPGDDVELESVYDNNTTRSTTTAPSTSAFVDLNKPASRTVHSKYAHLPECRDLTWEDDFFDDDDDDVVAVFDMDYELMEEYYSRIGWASMTCLLFFPQILWICLIGMAPCYLRRNVAWAIRAQHVAITRDGIRFVRDKRQTCWGLPCTDSGKVSKTVPFDKITDCDIHEPAGNTCFVIPNTLYSVHVDTASSDKGQHELTIAGLRNPLAFKKLVWAMKREYHPAAARLPMAMEMVGRSGSNMKVDGGTSTATNDNNGVVDLLREIRDELRTNNELVQSMKQQTQQQPTPSAPPAAELI